MKYCSKCGKELFDEAVVCPGCGCMVGEPVTPPAEQSKKKESVLKLAAKILMIISTVTMGLYIIPLAWCLPMTLTFCKKVKKNEPISTGFKVCILLFVNTIAGILLLDDSE